MSNNLLPPLFARLPAELTRDWQPAEPWQLLSKALPDFLDDLPSQRLDIAPPADAHLIGDRIAIGKGTSIQPGAVIEGPVWIGEDVKIRTGAYIRGGCFIDRDSVVGAHSEIKSSILLRGARAPHQNYVGDSVLGQGVNLGAGTILSNFRHDGSEIFIPASIGRLATGRRKLGALLGDGVKTGCNCVLHPGVVVGSRTQIYPGAHLRPGVYPAASVVKLRQVIEVSPLAPDASSP